MGIQWSVWARSVVMSVLGGVWALTISISVAEQASQTYHIAAQDLGAALRDFAHQSGRQILFSSDIVANKRAPRVDGALTVDSALTKLLSASGLHYSISVDGTILVTLADAKGASNPPDPPLAPSGAISHPSQTDPIQVGEVEHLETVVVTGSRIPRTAVEGPAPVVKITAEEIRNNGFATIADVMSSLSQNLGALDNNQYTNGFSPGAQAVDLRGLGPNHTLVLVNGRRIADYPQAYGGNSNFTDISNIPASIVERVEILSGSASAVYGSDAISGVINFILKRKADGVTVDYRAGATQGGGGDSQRLQLSGGFSTDRFDSVFAVELYNQHPLWAYQRNFTDSRLDSPANPADIVASQVFTRIDENGNYLDPGQATCDSLSHLDQGSVFRASRATYGPDNSGNFPGYYCGSYRDVGYGTLENGRRAINAYGSGSYHLSASTDLFVDLQIGASHQTSHNGTLQWQNSYPLNGDSARIDFYNQATGQIEQWQRKYFTIEENGGFDAGLIHSIDTSFSLNTGVKGSIRNTDWNYEALFGLSQNRLTSKEPALVSAKAQALFLGASLGVDPASGLNIYNAPISRLYTPLTVPEFRSITQLSIDNDKSRAENFTLTVNNSNLISLPAGPVGFAGVAEYGTQFFGIQADPLSLDGSYYGLHNTSAVGSRSHYGFGTEFSVPVLSVLQATAAARYDSYTYSATTTGKFTYATGLEYRPFKSLLIRGSFGTGFRAPDLSYLYAGLSGSSSGGIDYYLCRRDEPATGPSFSDCHNGSASFDGRSHGSTGLKDETSNSLTYGVVWEPINGLEFTADYYNIKLKNEVEYQPSDTVLREEANCRLGQTPDGQSVDINSGLCQQVIGQVVRNPVTATGGSAEAITSVLVLPINAAIDHTSGIDLDVRYLLKTERFGKFDFKAGYTEVLTHDIQLFPGDPVVDELKDLADYVIPRNKGNYSISWTKDKFTTTLHGTRVGALPNFDGTERLKPFTVYNATATYEFSPRATLTAVLDNLSDRKPPRDSTWISWPYYSRNWYSPVGRAYFLELSYRFGGKN